MDGFDHILNWTLKKGSHQFPGPDGGTCINEAALVAMGFEYRPINFAWQMPRCFSRPICRLAMLVNGNCSGWDLKGYVGMGSGSLWSVRRMASIAQMPRRRAVSTTERMSA